MYDRGEGSPSKTESSLARYVTPRPGIACAGPPQQDVPRSTCITLIKFTKHSTNLSIPGIWISVAVPDFIKNPLIPWPYPESFRRANRTAARPRTDKTAKKTNKSLRQSGGGLDPPVKTML
jgi:hypothetical protein